MKYTLDVTHNPELRSWVPSANESDTDFPIQNLPFGVFQIVNILEPPRIGVAIGDQILDLKACVQLGLLAGLTAPLKAACMASSLNPLMAMGQAAITPLRRRLSLLLQTPQASSASELNILVPMAEAQLLLPAQVGDYTDFYASIFHATNIGKLFRPEHPLLANYKHIPIAYHGRASSLRVSGSPILRPRGQQKPDELDDQPKFGLSERLDYELEVGFFIGPGNELGNPISIDQAESHLFGLCLVNDWSARDIQAWEYQPLGPFLGKSFATSLSPWVVTLDALSPFRCPAFSRAAEDPPSLPYLSSQQNSQLGGFDLKLEVWLQSAQMKAVGLAPIQLSQANLAQLYWTPAQMIAHHTSNGCNLRPGDLLASGTVSGPQEDSQGSLIEITQQGLYPIELPTGETRTFLADGDEVILQGHCQKTGYVRIGFGECRGVIQSF